MSASVRVVPLGGLGEVGMNCLVLEHQGQAIAIDCGITFPERDNGIEVLHPDFAYLLAPERELCGVVVTHGHEDHIGALPYLLAKRSAPVYAPAYATALIERRLSEHALDAPSDLVQTRLHQPYDVGPFRITHLRVTHSITDATSLAIETPAGMIVHTGDFNIDPTPPDGEYFDKEAFAGLGRAGVRLLLSDSTNVDNPGHSGSEATVIRALENHVRTAKGRVVVALFSSHIQRVKALLEVARQLHKKVCLLGRSTQTHVNIAKELGLVESFSDVLVDPKDIQDVPRSSALIVATGTQAEAGSALQRLAIDDHPYLTLSPGDTVVLSSRIIPGNERAVFHMLNELERRQVIVLTRHDDPELHVSGHGCQQEQTAMIQLVQPQTFIPVHGTYHHLQKHAKLAQTLGVKETLVIENGTIVELDTNTCHVVGQTPTDRVAIQAKRAIHPRVITDRELLGRVGIAITTFVLNTHGELLGSPQVLTRGILIEDESSETLDAASAFVRQALLKAIRSKDDTDPETLKTVARSALRRFFQQRLGQRPQTYAIVHQP